MQWAEYVKKAMFVSIHRTSFNSVTTMPFTQLLLFSQEVSSEPCAGAACLQMVHSLTQEASLLLRQPLEVASVPVKATRQKLQVSNISKG